MHNSLIFNAEKSAKFKGFAHWLFFGRYKNNDLIKTQNKVQIKRNFENEKLILRAKRQVAKQL